MAIIPLNIVHSERLHAICLITSFTTERSKDQDSVIILIDKFTNELWYQKDSEIFPFSCLSQDYLLQLYKIIETDPQALQALKNLNTYEAVEVYTKVAYGDITPKMMMELMN